MRRVVEYSDGNVITKEACAWIAQLDGDQPPSAEDLAALREWMNRSPAHGQELRRLAELWGDLNVLTELAGATAESSARAARRAAGPRAWRPSAAALSIACGCLLAVIGLVLIWNNGTHSPADVTYRTTIGEQMHQRLPDGSGLTLNTDSSVRLAFSEAQRAVWLLHGEAHFTVAHDRARPFVVYAGNGQVRAVGTAFSVRVQDREVEVVVTEGTVELAAAAAGSAGDISHSGEARISKLAMLEAGHTASFSDHVESLASVSADELARRVSWKQGKLVFSGEPLDAVVREVRRYTTRTIEFADPAVRELRVGGQFRVDDIDALFDALELSFGVEVTRDGDRIVLSMASVAPSN
nr:FecR domain-containing protein [uncultured Steroidobacter sp.]